MPVHWKKYFATLQQGLKSDGKKHLDVGSGAGECLLASSLLGHEVLGIDVGKTAVEAVQAEFQLEVRQTTLEEAGFLPSTWDMVTLNAVLEHVINPRSVLREAARVLRPGGVMAVLVPTTEFLGWHLLRWPWYSVHSGHLQYFSRQGLFRLMRDFGVEPYASSTEGKGLKGNQMARDVLRTDLAWNFFALRTWCFARGWACPEPISWFSNPRRVTEDPRLDMRRRCDKLVFRTRLFWDILGYPLHKLSVVLDRQQNLVVFGVKACAE
jgi:SAM-dependent methyltransferase